MTFHVMEFHRHDFSTVSVVTLTKLWPHWYMRTCDWNWWSSYYTSSSTILLMIIIFGEIYIQEHRDMFPIFAVYYCWYRPAFINYLERVLHIVSLTLKWDFCESDDGSMAVISWWSWLLMNIRLRMKAIPPLILLATKPIAFAHEISSLAITLI